MRSYMRVNNKSPHPIRFRGVTPPRSYQRCHPAYLECLSKQNDSIRERRLERPKILKVPKCSVCWEPLASQDCIILQKCQHSIHIGCLQDHVDHQIRDGARMIKCPIEGCAEKIQENDLQYLIKESPYVQKLLKNNRLKYEVARYPHLFAHCPTPDCNSNIRLQDFQVRYYCDECRKEVCLECKTGWHYNLTCGQFKQQIELQNDKAFLNLASQKGLKQCPQCRYWIEKNEGCNHITCYICKTQFCYGCGTRNNVACCK